MLPCPLQQRGLSLEKQSLHGSVRLTYMIVCCFKSWYNSRKFGAEEDKEMEQNEVVVEDETE